MNKLLRVCLPVLFSLPLVFLLAAHNLAKADPDAETGSSLNNPSSYVNIGTPRGLVVLPNGNIWYADSENKRIVQYDPATKTILRTVGRAGTAEGEFDGTPNSITRDSADNLYVLVGCLVYKLDSNGGFIARYDLHDNSDCAIPYSIYYDAHSNSLFVTDQDGGYVTKYSTSMEFIYKMGAASDNAPGDFMSPSNVTTDANGRIYVTDEYADNRLQVFSSDYTLLFEIKNWEDTGGGTTGFENIRGVTVLSDGTILALSQDGNHVIEKFDASGNHLATWGSNSGFLMLGPSFIARDSSNNIYVSDYMLNSIFKISSSGTILNAFSNNLYEDGKFFQPRDVTYGPDQHLYVLDGQNQTPRVQEFTNGGSYIATLFTLDETGPYGFQNLTFGPDNKLYISSIDHIQVWSKSGNSWSLDYKIQCSEENEYCAGLTSPVFDSNGNLYVGSYYTHDIVKFVIVGDQYVYDSEFAKFSGTGTDQIPADQVYEAVGLAIDSNDHLFVSDHRSLKEFDLTGESPTYVKTIISENGSLGGNNGNLVVPEALSIDPATNNLYLSDVIGNKIVVYSNSGTLISTIGVLGGGQTQLYQPSGTEINPVTNTLTIADTANGRLESLSGGNRILNLISSADVIIRTAVGSESIAMNAHAGVSLAGQAWDSGSEDLSDIPARLMFGAYVVADFTVDLSHGDLDWSAVNVQTLPGDSKALVVNLNQTTAPGISATHSLYVYRYSNQTSVGVCPDAAILADVSPECSNEYDLNQGDPGLSAVTVNGKNYWKVDGLNGTGAFSSLFETPNGLQDLMTREKVSTASDHQLSFSTTYDITHSDDTITVSFGPEWDTNSLTIDDIGLTSGSTTLALDTTASTDTWGVNIDSGAITFTAPTDGTGYITSGKAIKVTISNGVVINPDTVGSYPVSIRILTDDGSGGQNQEAGNIEVPIIDSDQVNITGFINTFIDFDIDTGTAPFVECAYNGCQSYAGGVNANNYTVDLGELTSSTVNKSQGAAVMHAAGTSGVINSIYFDLITNAYNGAVVTVTSQHGYLQGPDLNTIASVTDGDNITANSGTYGYTLPVAGSGNGTVNRNSACQDVTHYCGVATSPSTVFDTNSKPLDYGRLRMDLAAAAAYTNNPGSYQDTLTFIATATF